MSCLQSGEHECGGLFFRPFVLDQRVPGQDVIPGHEHVVDHVTFIGHGRVHVYAECAGGCAKPIDLELDAGQSVLVKANWRHRLTPVTETASGVCIFRAAEPNHALPRTG
jgi:hypothetical protein